MSQAIEAFYKAFREVQTCIWSVEFTHNEGVVYAMYCRTCNTEIHTGELFRCCNKCMALYCDAPCWGMHLQQFNDHDIHSSWLMIVGFYVLSSDAERKPLGMRWSMGHEKSQ